MSIRKMGSNLCPEILAPWKIRSKTATHSKVKPPRIPIENHHLFRGENIHFFCKFGISGRIKDIFADYWNVLSTIYKKWKVVA
jgi:hypothetical protein